MAKSHDGILADRHLVSLISRVCRFAQAIMEQKLGVFLPCSSQRSRHTWLVHWAACKASPAGLAKRLFEENPAVTGSFFV
ncbi:hypothetical protein X474_16225 [Dethiosulfatarculus sandiegensis]|uniref:Uncharacterized protein n=1 Tax=Dethiosulfatarculus sandiegensis TaxID=1429043 RepID=A0A0D2HR69_9BACT|nr:hypothetical protein X474_16225 [Dethiosulfatarculus sandiegensis]